MVPLAIGERPTPRAATCQRLPLVLTLATSSKHVDRKGATYTSGVRTNGAVCPRQRGAGWETSAPMHIILPAVLFAF